MCGLETFQLPCGDRPPARRRPSACTLRYFFAGCGIFLQFCAFKIHLNIRIIIKSSQPLANNQHPAAISQQLAVTSQQPAASIQQPAASSQQPASNSQQSSNSLSGQLAVSRQQPVASDQQQAVSSWQPLASSQQQSAVSRHQRQPAAAASNHQPSA